LERSRFCSVFRAIGQAPRGLRGRVVVANPREARMRYALLWLLGIPIPVLILLYLFKVI